MLKLKKLFGVILLSSFTASASAGIVTFNDRGLFESYIGTFVVDNLDTASGSSSSDLSNDDYSWTMSDYACVNSSGCSYSGTNPFDEGSNDWVWTYGSGSFEMNFEITAFGLDFANPHNADTGEVGLEGFNSGIKANGSFFGVATDDGSTLNSIAYLQNTSYLGFDNVTYSTTVNGVGVSEPHTLAIFSLLLMGISLRRRKKA